MRKTLPLTLHNRAVTQICVHFPYIVFVATCPALRTWAVCAVLSTLDKRTCVERVLSSTDDDVSLDSEVVSLAISSDSILAVATSLDGIFLFRLAYAPFLMSRSMTSIAPSSEKESSIARIKSVRFINESRALRSMVVLMSADKKDKVFCFGDFSDEREVVQRRIMRSEKGGITCFDACEAGVIATLMGGRLQLHVFVLRKDKDVFEHRVLGLQLYNVRPEDTYAFLDLTASESHVSFSYCLPSRTEHGGVVDQFALEGLRHVSRFVYSNALPTALESCADRVLVGTSRWKGTSASMKNMASGVYIFSARSSRSMRVFKGGCETPQWEKGSLGIDDRQWVFIKRVFDCSTNTWSQCLESACVCDEDTDAR